MGIERATTRWYLQRQVYLDEAALLITKLNAIQAKGPEPESNERAEFEKQLAHIRAKLLALGPCPTAMMG